MYIKYMNIKNLSTTSFGSATSQVNIFHDKMQQEHLI